MNRTIRIGTRESQLALWQAAMVMNLVEDAGYKAELVLIKSDGDTDLKTPALRNRCTGHFYQSIRHSAAQQRDRYSGAFYEGCVDGHGQRYSAGGSIAKGVL